MIGTVVEIGALVITDLWKRLFRAAVLANTYCRAFIKFDGAATHFAFEYSHPNISPDLIVADNVQPVHACVVLPF